jgi:iron complex transport system ATP-binding protein
VRNLYFAYEEKDVLSGISSEISAGEMVGIIGPNSAGKSTLLHIICGLLRARAGEVLINSRPLASLSRKELAKSVALVPQIILAGLPFTVAQTVLMGRNPHRSAVSFDNENDVKVVTNALLATDTYHLRDRYIDELSGGERQRVMIAKALAQETLCVLMDEPTAFLDVKHQITVMETVRKLNRERNLTVLFVSHDINLAAAFFQRVILIRDGAVIADGQPEKVVTRENLLAAYDVEMAVLSGERGVRVVAPLARGFLCER